MLMEDGDRVIEILVGLVGDRGNVELCHRGIEILKNLMVEGMVKGNNRAEVAVREMARHEVDQVRAIAEEALTYIK
jgi:hypothetical protein